MADALVALLGVAIGLPVLGGVVSALAGGSTGARRWGTAIGCGLGAVAAAAGLAVMRLAERSGEAVAFPRWGSFEWLAFGGPSASDVAGPTGGAGPMGIAFGLQFDALGWAAACSVLVTLALLATTMARTSEERSRTAGSLLVVTGLAAVGVVLATNLVQVLACGMLASFGAYLVAAMEEGRVPVGLPARRVLLAQLLGDGLFVVAVLLAWTRVGTLEVDVFSHSSGEALAAFLGVANESTAGLHRAVVGLIGFAVLGWVVARSAGFPLFGSAFEASRLPLPAGGVSLAVIGPCMVLALARFSGVFTVAEDVRYVAAMTGGLTALLAGLSAAFQPEARSALALATASLLGTAVVGLASMGTPDGGAAAMGGVCLAIALGPLTAIGWYAVAIAESKGGLDRDARLLRALAIGCVGGLLAGVFGQNAIVEALLRGEGTGSTALAVLLLGGLVATGFALVRAFVLLDRSTTDADVIVVSGPSAARGREVLWVAIGMTAFVLGASWLTYDGWWTGLVGRILGVGASPSVLGLGVATLASVPGGVAAWLLRASDREDSSAIVGRAGPLGRMARSRFYLDDALQLFVSLPIRGVAQLCRFVDWFVLDGLVTGVPRVLLGTADASLRPVRGGPVQVGILTLVLALAVLAAVVVWR